MSHLDKLFRGLLVFYIAIVLLVFGGKLLMFTISWFLSLPKNITIPVSFFLTIIITGIVSSIYEDKNNPSQE